jgi:hypothetical protein
MAEASKNDLFGDLSYGDETRRNGDYVGLPHDEASNTVKTGEAVRVNGSGNIVRADATGDAVGILSNFERSGDSGGPSDPAPIDQDQDANVKVGGVVKAVVESDVSAGEYLTPGNSTDGVLDNNAPDTESRFLALTDAVEDDRADGTTVNYAEVLIQ